MPRYYRRRYTKVIKPKKKWASNISRFGMEPPSDNQHQGYGSVFNICANSSQATTPIPTVVKVGNVKVQLDVVFTTVTADLVTSYAFVLFVPEGTGPIYVNPNQPTTHETYSWGTAFIARHPEWIMCCKLIGSNYGGDVRQNYDRVTFSSRLKRNLNSGDRIVLFVSAGTEIGEGPNIADAHGNVLIQFWTCAN